jgi:hypothetical protein
MFTEKERMQIFTLYRVKFKTFRNDIRKTELDCFQKRLI